jgi:8-oxo-dGTP pyrophosphatase MutT (NUDIX family)
MVMSLPRLEFTAGIVHDRSMAVEPRLAATVVLIRDAEPGLELLLLERQTRERKAGARLWVFPGGQVEQTERAGRAGDAEDSARRAAVRETQEEAGLELSDSSLMPISRWITPEIAPKRFDTWFFLSSVAQDETVCVDGAEISDHRWLTPPSALDAHHRGEIRLAPPTFVTVSWLAPYGETADALQSLEREPLLTFRPRICGVPDGACMLYPGDAGYEDGVHERPGPRHRLWTLPAGWRYERGISVDT